MNIDARDVIGDEASPAVFEDVESRTLMSVATLEEHELSIQTGDGNDSIELSLNDDASELTATVNGHAQSFAANEVYHISVDAGGGDNRVVFDPRIAASSYIVTGDGRDVIYGGGGKDFINSGGGRDVVDARAGNDTILAGSGNDKVNAGSGDDVVNAGSGNDSISADGGRDTLMGRKGNDKFYADADDVVRPDGGRNQVNVSPLIRVRDDGYVAPRVTSVAIVDADTGEAVAGYESLGADAVLEPAKLPARYTVLANVEEGVKSVSFELVGDKSLWRRDHDGTFSMTNDAGAGKFTAWQPTAGVAYTLNVGANTAEYFKGLSGDVFQIKLTLRKTVDGAGTPTSSTPTAPTTPAADPAAPKVKLNVVTADAIVGQGFHAEATQTTIAGYGVEDARFEWDFGDPAGKHNVLPGFNAAHVYDKAGAYRVTLTVTAPGGKVSRVTQSVNVRAAAMRTIYVAANGNDANEGASQDKAVRTLGRAAQLVTNDTRVLLRRGDTFGVTGAMEIEDDNVEIATYGVGGSPVIRYEGARTPTTLVRLTSAAQNVAINGLTFDSIYGADNEQTNMCHAINLAGTNVTVRGNTFLNVGYAVNANGSPNGAYVVDNAAPLEDGVRGYFVFGQGSNLAIVGNTVANSTREHNVRLMLFTNALVAGNELTNLDRRNGVDAADFAKCSVNVQRGAFAYVANNVVHNGNVAMGPLGGGDGLSYKDDRFEHGVIDGNTIDNTQIIVQHGASGVTIRDNAIGFNDDTQIIVRGWNAEYGRGIADLVIDHNVGANAGTHGRFLEVSSHSEGIVLTNNVYVAPRLAPGGWGAAGIVVAEGNMSSFRTINGNVWPTATRSTATVEGGLMSIGSDYVTPGTWNAYPVVGTDGVRDDVSATDAWKLVGSMLKAA